MSRLGIALSLAVAIAACAPAPSRPAGTLDALRAKGILVVAIRVEAPPPDRNAGDPAHAQKRAFEAAVALIVARRVIGPDAKVELRSTGADRIAGLDQGADVAMTVDVAAARDRALISPPYAAASIVLAAKTGGPVKQLEDIRGAALAVAMDELGARAIAQAYLQEHGIAATLDTYMGVSGSATAVDAGKAVALIGDKIGVSIIAADRNLTTIAAIAQRPYVIAVRKSAPDLAAAIADALRAALASGEIRDAATKAAFPYETP